MQFEKKDGSFALPLYHGTSSYFCREILTHGMGARNIVQELNLLNLAQHLVDVAEEMRIGVEFGTEERMILAIMENIIQQGITAGGMNARHGGVYLTTGRKKAAAYSRNAKGSEMLTEIDKLVSIIEPQRAGFRLELEAKFPLAVAAIEADHSPVVLQVDRALYELLRDEKGDDPARMLNIIPSDFQLDRDDEFLEFLTFEYLGVISPNNIVVSSA
jgi:hypothetical protein